jgi:hypothetical protein
VCTGVSREVPRRLGWRHHGAMHDGRGTQSSPVGNAAGGPAGSTSERGAGLGTRPEGVCSGDARGPHHGLGRMDDRPRGTSRTGRRYDRRRVADVPARAH